MQLPEKTSRKAPMAATMILTLAASFPAAAQAFRAETLVNPTALLVEGEAAASDTVILLSGLAVIERDLMLGMLFLQDGLISTEGSHFTHPRKDILPPIKDKLTVAGITDLEEFLVVLESATDNDAVTEAHKAVVTAVLQAESSLQPSEQEKILAVVEGLRIANSQFNAAGPTDVVKYQEGWASLMINRNKIDQLTKSTDPVIAKEALAAATAMDDVILSLPDPAVTAPVDFDPAPVAALLAEIEVLAGAV